MKHLQMTELYLLKFKRWAEKSFWRHFLIFVCFVVLLAFIVYLVLDSYSARYVSEHGGTLPDYSNAGQYLNFVVGVPLAVTAALIGAFVSYQIGHFTKTKDDFSILEFVDKVSAPIFGAQSRIALALDSITRSGADIYWTIDRVVSDRLKDKIGDAFWDEIDAICEEKESELRPHVEKMLVAVRDISDQYTTLTSQMNSALFLKMHGTKRNLLPASYLASHAPRSLNPNDKELMTNATIHNMVEPLIWMVDTANVYAMVRAYHFIPQGPFSFIYYLGMVFWSPEVSFKSPVQLRNGVRITSYSVNIGSALLVSLYKSLPDKDDMLQSFEALMTIPDVASRYLRIAGPRMSEMAKKEIEDRIDEIVNAPEKLIILYPETGAPVYYNPKLHGDIRNLE